MDVLHVGLTGGIASGKSAVSSRLAGHGALVIDADELAREVVRPGSQGLNEVIEEFGTSVLDERGVLDRSALGRIVFRDPAARERLNGIVHPRVRERARALREAARPGSIVVEDIPLLVETGQQGRFDVVVVVNAPEEERIRRIVEDRHGDEDQARSRIAAQTADEERLAVADFVLQNSGTLDELHQQVDALWARLQAARQEKNGAVQAESNTDSTDPA